MSESLRPPRVVRRGTRLCAVRELRPLTPPLASLSGHTRAAHRTPLFKTSHPMLDFRFGFPGTRVIFGKAYGSFPHPYCVAYILIVVRYSIRCTSGNVEDLHLECTCPGPRHRHSPPTPFCFHMALPYSMRAMPMTRHIRWYDTTSHIPPHTLSSVHCRRPTRQGPPCVRPQKNNAMPSSETHGMGRRSRYSSNCTPWVSAACSSR